MSLGVMQFAIYAPACYLASQLSIGITFPADPRQCRAPECVSRGKAIRLQGLASTSVLRSPATIDGNCEARAPKLWRNKLSSGNSLVWALRHTTPLLPTFPWYPIERLTSELSRHLPRATKAQSSNFLLTQLMANLSPWRNIGNWHDLSSVCRGFVTLIVNVASKCGLTDTNYRQLQELHTRLAGKGLRILAFPCNQFGHQEPWSDTEIKRWVTEKYNVEFDMFSKIDVNGSNAHPLYKFLKHEQGGFLISAIKWNFAKFLVGRDGIPVRRYSPQTKPLEIEKDIIALLEQ
ncbi:unnamed protein product [Dicrocoelium dendriticum]|nr:unnamed protein product [Dicrocoelium dendriticum]